MYRGRVVANKTDREGKISLLTHKWIKYKEHGSWVWYMERQKELQLNSTKIAKMKKTAHKGVIVNAKHRHEKKAIAK